LQDVDPGALIDEDRWQTRSAPGVYFPVAIEKVAGEVRGKTDEDALSNLAHLPDVIVIDEPKSYSMHAKQIMVTSTIINHSIQKV
jgi:hypothetical protein